MLLSWRECCHVVILRSKNISATMYAEAGLKMTRPAEISAQAVYILNNLAHWTGPIARDTKASLRHYEKEGKQ
jgi:hypothetical protein